MELFVLLFQIDDSVSLSCRFLCVRVCRIRPVTKRKTGKAERKPAETLTKKDPTSKIIQKKYRHRPAERFGDGGKEDRRPTIAGYVTGGKNTLGKLVFPFFCAFFFSFRHQPENGQNYRNVLPVL